MCLHTVEERSPATFIQSFIGSNLRLWIVVVTLSLRGAHRVLAGASASEAELSESIDLKRRRIRSEPRCKARRPNQRNLSICPFPSWSLCTAAAAVAAAASFSLIVLSSEQMLSPVFSTFPKQRFLSCLKEYMLSSDLH